MPWAIGEFPEYDLTIAVHILAAVKFAEKPAVHGSAESGVAPRPSVTFCLPMLEILERL